MRAKSSRDAMHHRSGRVLSALALTFLVGGLLQLTSVPASAAAANSISAGNIHSCVISAGGGAKCWGANGEGEVGNGTTTDSATPVDVSGLTSGVGAISAGGFHTCALTTAGGVKCWGNNREGELGNDTASSTGCYCVPSPVDVFGLSSGVAQIATGASHTCALTTTGGVKCWGFNLDGELGNGTTTNSLKPIDVSGLTSGVGAISAGGSQSCALTTAGGVKCWGLNNHGQLGDGTTTDSSTPVAVPGLTAGVLQISVGSFHTCALTTAGGVKCWGYNNYGQLGDGTTTDSPTPVTVSGLSSGVAQISTGYSQTCARTTAGSLKCWGYNPDGELGNGMTTTTGCSCIPTPGNVSGLPINVAMVSAGGTSTCALTTVGSAKCWGYNFDGELGTGTTSTTGCLCVPSPADIYGFADYRPDGQLSYSAGAYVGNDIYNTTGASQLRTVKIRRGRTATFHWKIQNDGNLSDRIVFATSGNSAGFTVSFHIGTANVTKAVVAGTYAKNLASGTWLTITVNITVLANARVGAVKSERLKATSTHQPVSDVVLAKITATS